MEGIQEMFHEFSTPDEFEVGYQLELFVWARNEAQRERSRLLYAVIKSTPALREARNAYCRERAPLRREYWRDHKRTKRGPLKQTHHCSACGEAGHRVTTCAQQVAA